MLISSGFCTFFCVCNGQAAICGHEMQMLSQMSPCSSKAALMWCKSCWADPAPSVCCLVFQDLQGLRWHRDCGHWIDVKADFSQCVWDRLWKLHMCRLQQTRDCNHKHRFIRCVIWVIDVGYTCMSFFLYTQEICFSSINRWKILLLPFFYDVIASLN